jgi:hypothetical protein
VPRRQGSRCFIFSGGQRGRRGWSMATTSLAAANFLGRQLFFKQVVTHQPFFSTAIRPQLGASHEENAPARPPALDLLRPVGFREHEAISARWQIGRPCFGGASVMASVQSPVPQQDSPEGRSIEVRRACTSIAQPGGGLFCVGLRVPGRLERTPSERFTRQGLAELHARASWW